MSEITVKSAVQKAVIAHQRWKQRLTAAVDQGRFELPWQEVAKDNLCEFGKMLYSDALTEEDKSSMSYEQVRQLHAEFHLVAAEVVKLIEDGKKEEALAAMDNDSRFQAHTSKLVKALLAWRTEG